MCCSPWPCVATQARLRLLHSAMEPTDAQSVSSSGSGSSSGSTAASEGDFWKGHGYQCDRCGRPWKWYPDPRVCQHCRDMHAHRHVDLGSGPASLLIPALTRGFRDINIMEASGAAALMSPTGAGPHWSFAAGIYSTRLCPPHRRSPVLCWPLPTGGLQCCCWPPPTGGAEFVGQGIGFSTYRVSASSRLLPRAPLHGSFLRNNVRHPRNA